MKKKYLRSLRLLARQLPESWELRTHTKHFSGEQIRVNKMKNDLDEIVDHEIYKATGMELFKVNHYNRLKKAYRRGKEQGIIDYLIWLRSNNEKTNKAFAEWEREQIPPFDERILKIISGGAGKLWKNIIMFFYAFTQIFMKKEEAAT